MGASGREEDGWGARGEPAIVLASERTRLTWCVRSSVRQILDGFPQSKFLMFGDSAEQDLDLYSAIAQQRSHQVRLSFVRCGSLGLT